MTTPRHEPDEPATPDLHDQWAASRLDALQAGLADLLDALLVTEEGAPAPAVPRRTDHKEARPPQRSR
ncbi:hypothetical protein [Streptomyces laurentii]|uniref:hypothetical protein n=1 Tax=Streptomyces laurentii TaxID=39478 RepID=UPI00369B4D5F